MKNDIIISKMIDYIEKIQRYTKGMSYEKFKENDMALEASVFNLSEASRYFSAVRLHSEFKETHPEIPWHKIYGLRNHIIHDYEGVNLELVWQIIEGDLPDLTDKLKSL